MRRLNNIIERISHTLLITCGILTMLMGFAVTYGVFMRYVFRAPEPYTYEISAILLLLVGVLAFAGVEMLDRNVRNDLIFSRFPGLVKSVALNIVFPVLALLVVAIFTWKSMDNALYSLRIGQISASSWAIPLAPIKFVIPVGYTLLCLILIGKLIRGLASLKGMKSRDGIDEPGIPGTL